jgi:hypothetical protein
MVIGKVNVVPTNKVVRFQDGNANCVRDTQTRYAQSDDIARTDSSSSGTLDGLAFQDDLAQ